MSQKNKIKFLDLQSINLRLKNIFIEDLSNNLDNGWFIGGESVNKFENEYAAINNCKYCIGCSNGLDAIRLALLALGVGRGDSVIVPAHTFIATWLSVTSLGANVIPLDVDDEHLFINIDLIHTVFNQKVKAIIGVNLYGSPGRVDELRRIANHYEISLIGDLAQAHLTTFDNSYLTNYYDISCWSFYPAKTLGALGDGGAITTNDQKYADNIRKLANYGSSAKYIHHTLGINSRLDSLQARFLSSKLKLLSSDIEIRKNQADIYQKKLSPLPIKIVSNERFKEHTFHLYTIRTIKRDLLIKYLKDLGIETSIHYPIPCFRQKAYSYLKLDPNDYPISDKVSQEILSLPIGPHLNINDINFVSDKVIEFFNKI